MKSRLLPPECWVTAAHLSILTTLKITGPFLSVPAKLTDHKTSNPEVSSVCILMAMALNRLLTRLPRLLTLETTLPVSSSSGWPQVTSACSHGHHCLLRGHRLACATSPQDSLSACAKDSCVRVPHDNPAPKAHLLRLVSKVTNLQIPGAGMSVPRSVRSVPKTH